MHLIDVNSTINTWRLSQVWIKFILINLIKKYRKCLIYSLIIKTLNILSYPLDFVLYIDYFIFFQTLRQKYLKNRFYN